MSGIQVIENKISAIRKYLSILERYRPYGREEIEQNVDIRGALERYLYLAIQSMIDCAEAVIAYKNFRKPTTLSDAFYILQEEGVLSSGEAHSLAGLSGFRNIIAHGYERIDYDIVHSVLHEELQDIERFAKSMEIYCA